MTLEGLPIYSVPSDRNSSPASVDSDSSADRPWQDPDGAAELPAFGSAASSCAGTCVWDPALESSESSEPPLEGYLARAASLLSDSRLRGVWEEAALTALFSCGGDEAAALATLPLEEATAAARLWSSAEIDELVASQGRFGGSDLRLVTNALGGRRTLAEVVAAAYKSLPALRRDTDVETRLVRSPGPAAVHSPRARECPPSLSLSSLSAMMAHQLVEAAPAAISVKDASGEVVLADLLDDGTILHLPADGGAPQQFRSPGGFVRFLRPRLSATSVEGGSWKVVCYKGLPLDLIRKAATSDDRALGAVAAADCTTTDGRAPRPSSPGRATGRQPPLSPGRAAAVQLREALHDSHLLERSIPARKRQAATSSRASKAPRAAAEDPALLERAEREEEQRACRCHPPCGLRPMLESQAVHPGQMALSVCIKGVLTSADITTSGSIRLTPSLGSDLLELQSPCALLRVARRRAGLAADKGPSARAAVYYKGIALGALQEPSQVRRRDRRARGL